MRCVAETVTVEGEAPVIEASAVERSSYIDKNSIRTLPNNGRNVYDFMSTPGL